MDGKAEEARVFKSLFTDADKRSVAVLKQRLDALVERGEPVDFAELRSIQQELGRIMDKYVGFLLRADRAS
jgi:hypothetical protein